MRPLATWQRGALTPLSLPADVGLLAVQVALLPLRLLAVFGG